MVDAACGKEERRWAARYALLTVLLFAPLVWAFASVRNLYPFAAWTVMLPVDASRGHTYHVLRGETHAGETVDLRAIELADALTGRHWSLLRATADNAAFKIRSPHPSNVAMTEAAGGTERLPAGARLAELLRAYGDMHNSRLAPGSPQRLRAVRLEEYTRGGGFADHSTLVRSWRQEL